MFRFRLRMESTPIEERKRSWKTSYSAMLQNAGGNDTVPTPTCSGEALPTAVVAIGWLSSYLN